MRVRHSNKGWTGEVLRLSERRPDTHVEVKWDQYKNGPFVHETHIDDLEDEA
jgi:hypothetical protein